MSIKGLKASKDLIIMTGPKTKPGIYHIFESSLLFMMNVLILLLNYPHHNTITGHDSVLYYKQYLLPNSTHSVSVRD